ncbi:MAG: TadE family protein [Pirellulales bacterium]
MANFVSNRKQTGRASRRRPWQPSARQGVAAVEFAFMAPILVTIVFGMVSLGRAFEMQNLLDVAAREGARFASIDREGLLASGQTSNQKLIQDVKNFLAANGVPKNKITVQVKDHQSPTADFDLDNPANSGKLFEVKISVNFSAVSLQPVPAADDYALHAMVVFRNGRATISQ